jgi:RNA polymerase sigma-70 factor, ECF subfamily
MSCRSLPSRLEVLPVSQREVITLRDVEQWSSEEVCNVLGISETNQRVLLHRARSGVRRALESYWTWDGEQENSAMTRCTLSPISAVLPWPPLGCPRQKDRLLDQDNQPKPASRSNAELVERAQRGEEKAFEALYHQHKQRVYALCLQMIRNIAEAEELTQEAFLLAFRKIYTFRGESAFSTWLHRLSVNVVLQRLRKKTYREASLEDSADGKEFDERRAEIGAPDPVLIGSIDRVQLERATAQLAPGYKLAFVLHDVQGYEHKEIAAMLGCSIGNSKSQLHKARIRLRKLLQEEGRESAKNELHFEVV